MPHNICIFEDKRFCNFYPLSLSQPVFDLRVGASSLRLRVQDEFSESHVHLLCREYLAPITRIKSPDAAVNEAPRAETVFLNGRLLCMGEELRSILDVLPEGSVGVKGGYVVAARLSGDGADALGSYFMKRLSDEAIDAQCRALAQLAGREAARPSPWGNPHAGLAREGDYEDAHLVGEDNVEEKLPVDLTALIKKNGLQVVKLPEARLLSFPWQLIECNADIIRDDFARMPLRGPSDESVIYPGVHVIGEEDIFIGDGAVVKPGVVLDASDGPILIGDRSVVMASAVIIGPVAIGMDCVVRAGAKILGGTSCGNVCKLGGEIDETIFGAYSNKQHDGFIGHSYLGEWVNIGAASNNSDLKNNYSPVRMWNAGREKNTGRQFLGLLMGDHTKTGINTLFNTGTVVGFNCNVFSSEMPAKFVPSYSWGHGADITPYDLERAMQTASVVLERRNVRFCDAHREIFLRVSALSEVARRNI